MQKQTTYFYIFLSNLGLQKNVTNR